jgi:DNA-binding NtrC family response regulator
MSLSAQEYQAPTRPSQHILLVEDEPNVAKGLEMVLTDEGYGVNLAVTGHDALEMSSDTGFDLVVADLRLPDIDGLEVIRRIKVDRPDARSVIITGFPSVTSAISAVRMGVQDYLRKPFTDDELISVVGGALKDVEETSVEELLVKAEGQTLIQKEEVLRALDTAAREHAFSLQLMEDGSRALASYDLTEEAKAAIITGDLSWIRNHVGKLTEDQQTWLFRRLEQEVW